MQLMKLLHKTLGNKLPLIHKTRFKNLMSATETLIKVNKLTLTALGRNLSKKHKPRSNIKKIDRLLGSLKLHDDNTSIYKVMNSYLVTEGSRSWIHIDWSCVCSITKLYLLRASLSMSGRSIVIYEECHPKAKENNHATHKEFLNNLKAILPASVKPVIVTDAGFRAPWFDYVRTIGWDFVGRLRNKNLVRMDSTSTWQLSHSLYEGANGTPTYLGHGVLTEAQQVPAHFILYKGKKKNRHKLTENKTRSLASKSKRHAKAQKEPWLLVTSLTSLDNIALEVVKIYRQRMRIEENFRDTKCTRYGFGLKESRSRSTIRMKALLLIAAIATFACWLAGLFTRQKGEASDYQAHSSKFTSALSNVYLGREALKKGFRIGAKQFENVLQLLFSINVAAQLETANYE
jgi:hypothetical protein